MKNTESQNLREMPCGGGIRLLEESNLHQDDKSVSGKYALFCAPVYTDKNYHEQYPTIYHLRSELLKSEQPHDIRLVYLAVSHLDQTDGPEEILKDQTLTKAKKNKVTQKARSDFLKGRGCAEPEISGIDGDFKSSLKTFRDMDFLDLPAADKEEIARSITIFGDDKKCCAAVCKKCMGTNFQRKRN